MVPCDFFLFLKLKRDLAGTRFSSEQELFTAVTTGVSVGTLSTNGLLHVFEMWAGGDVTNALLRRVTMLRKAKNKFL